jgi:hypothetical protein
VLLGEHSSYRSAKLGGTLWVFANLCLDLPGIVATGNHLPDIEVAGRALEYYSWNAEGTAAFE